jgi:imidazolonepropionase-like amidohydrolase
MVRSADDMGVGWLDAWPTKPSWVRTALRGITGPRAPGTFEAFAAVAEDPIAAGTLAEEAIRSGATMVKLIATGSGIGSRDEAVTPLLEPSSVGAIGRVARRHRVPLVVHCHGGSILEAVLDAGAARIEHGLHLSGSDLASIRDTGASVIVTPGAYLDHGSSEARRGLGSLVRSLLAQEVSFGLGTDGHGQTMLGQVRAMVTLGVPFERAIEAALEPGAAMDETSLGHGDLILFHMDPAEHPEALDHPVARLRRGPAATGGGPAT